jgi:outer membrane protein OmpA-like peptidoglycan-associated protein
MLGEQSDRVALIADISLDPQSKLYDPELSRARVASVERYLLAAGIDRDRLHIEGRTAHDGSVENGILNLDAAEKMNRIVRISLDSRNTQ